MPSRAESSLRRSSIGQSQMAYSNPAGAIEPAILPRKDVGKFLKPLFDPLCAVGRAFAQEEGASNAPLDAVIPSRNGNIDQLRACNCHGWRLQTLSDSTQVTCPFPPS